MLSDQELEKLERVGPLTKRAVTEIRELRKDIELLKNQMAKDDRLREGLTLLLEEHGFACHPVGAGVMFGDVGC